MTNSTHVDPRGPRFGAAITSILSLIAFYLSFANQSLAYATVVALGVLFTWSLVSPRHPPLWLVVPEIYPAQISCAQRTRRPETAEVCSAGRTSVCATGDCRWNL